jgi:hypothetical protein
VPETVPDHLLQKANGWMAIARYAAFPLGAAVGGTLVATIGAGWALLLDGATYGTSALLLGLMQLPALARRGSAPNFIRELREGWKAFIEHTWVWLLTSWIAFYFLITYAPFFVLGPYVAKQSLGGAGAWAVIVTGEAIGSLAGGVAGLRIRPSRPLVATGALFAVTAIQCVLLAIRAPVVVIGAAAVLAGFAFAFGSVIWDTCIQRTIPREKLSRVTAYSWLAAMAFLPAGYALAGPIASVIGVSTSLWIGAAWVVLSSAAVVFVPDVRNFRSREATPDVTPVAPVAAS